MRKAQQKYNQPNGSTADLLNQDLLSHDLLSHDLLSEDLIGGSIPSTNSNSTATYNNNQIEDPNDSFNSSHYQTNSYNKMFDHDISAESYEEDFFPNQIEDQQKQFNNLRLNGSDSSINKFANNLKKDSKHDDEGLDLDLEINDEIFPEKRMHSAKSRARPNFSISRDEMNLAEFPLAALTTRVDPSVKTLEFRDTQRLKGGELVEREWIITGADKFGLPTSTDDDVLLGLIRLTVENGFRSRKVIFTRYELMRILHWAPEGRNYTRLSKSLDRLSGVRIKASNSFYDNESKNFKTKNFGIVDSYQIVDGRNSRSSNKGGIEKGDQSYFIWSEVLFNSFKSGFIKKLDLDFYFQLNSAVARRLYRYLDKHFYFRSVVEKPLKLLAFEKLGLSRSYQYISSIKQQIEPALEELIKVGYLKSFDYTGRGEDTIIRIIANREQVNIKEILSKNNTAESNNFAQQRENIYRPTPSSKNQGLVDSYLSRAAEIKEYNGASNRLAKANKVVSDHHSNITNVSTNSDENSDQIVSFKNSLFVDLVKRGIREQDAKNIVSNKAVPELARIKKIINYFDKLLSSNDKKVSISPAGFLFKAVISPFKFNLPDDYSQLNSLSQNSSASKRPEHKIFRAEKGRVAKNIPAENRALVNRTVENRAAENRTGQVKSQEIQRGESTHNSKINSANIHNTNIHSALVQNLKKAVDSEY